MKQQTIQPSNKKAFTLVELVVVIIILAILWTIAFISLEGYGRQTRDSVRVSDLSAMKISLDLFFLDANKYPESSDTFAISYSWAELWKQGTFWDSVFVNIEKLDKAPTDPLTEKPYTYSVTASKQEYQLAGIYESQEVALDAFWDAYAWEAEWTAMVTWNYNGVVAKSLIWSGTGTECALITVPSIISNQPSTVTDYEQIVNSGWLVYHGYKNLPGVYKSSRFKVDGGFDFSPSNFIAYKDTDNCIPLTLGDDDSARIEMMLGMQAAYSGTVLENDSKYKKIMEFNTLDATGIETTGNTFVNNFLNGDLKIRSFEEVPPKIKNIPNITIENGGDVNLDLSNYITYTNGDAITGYAITSWTLPTGVTLVGGVISGTNITTTGEYNIWVKASDNDGQSNEFVFNIRVDAPTDVILLNNQFNSYANGIWRVARGLYHYTYYYWWSAADYTYDNAENIRIEWRHHLPWYGTVCYARVDVWLVRMRYIRDGNNCGVHDAYMWTWVDFVQYRRSTNYWNNQSISSILNTSYAWKYELKPTWEYKLYRNWSVYRSWTLASQPPSGWYWISQTINNIKSGLNYITVTNPVEFDW